MNPYATLLQPPDHYVQGISTGRYILDAASNRVRDPSTGEYVAALVPGDGLARKMAELPADSVSAQSLLQSTSIGSLLPVVTAMSTIGALASVATLGVCIVNFRRVLKRLDRVEAQLDRVLAGIDSLHDRLDTVSSARIHAASELLERAVVAESAGNRRHLAEHARALFQRAKHEIEATWQMSQPWQDIEFEIAAAISLENRFIACALGDVQAEFLLGEPATVRHALTETLRALNTTLNLDPVEAFRARSDQACRSQLFDAFAASLASRAGEIADALRVHRWSCAQIAAFAADADLAVRHGVEPVYVLRALRHAEGDGFYALVLRPDQQAA